MNYLPKFFLAVACLVGGALGASAQGDAEFNPLGREIPIESMEKQLRIQVEWIELSHVELTKLLEPDDFSKPGYRHSSNAGPLRERLKKMADQGEAKIIETAIVVARSGQRAKVESIHELIYPTEYDPPELSTPGGDDDDETDASTASLPTATAFETRNCGTTLEVDPVIGADGITIDLNLAPEIVYPVGEAVFGHYQSGESEVEMKMPIFYAVRTTTQITMIAGEYNFVGAMTPVAVGSGLPDFERKVMMFVKADMIYTGLPPEKAEEKKK